MMLTTTVYPLSADRTSPAAARARVRAAMGSRGPGEMREAAEVVVSELVTNAVRYGTEPISLALSVAADDLRIEVCDAESDVAAVAPRDPSPGEPTGRGLRLVEVLSKSWGVVGHGDGRGKTVWAVVTFR